MVVALSHVALGDARVCPDAGQAGRALNDVQHAMVRMLHSLTVPLMQCNYGPTSRGEKLERLNSYIDSLSRTALGHRIQTESSRQVSFNASRMPFMKSDASFDATPWLSTFEAACLVEPRLLKKDKPEVLPRVAPQQGSLSELVHYFTQWDMHHRLRLFPHSMKANLRFSKIFPVPKSEAEDRGVMDRRIPKCFEEGLQGEERYIPSAHDLVEYEADPVHGTVFFYRRCQ